MDWYSVDNKFWTTTGNVPQQIIGGPSFAWQNGVPPLSIRPATFILFAAPKPPRNKRYALSRVLHPFVYPPRQIEYPELLDPNLFHPLFAFGDQYSLWTCMMIIPPNCTQRFAWKLRLWMIQPIHSREMCTPYIKFVCFPSVGIPTENTNRPIFLNLRGIRRQTLRVSCYFQRLSYPGI